jgi:hypothetical protein
VSCLRCHRDSEAAARVQRLASELKKRAHELVQDDTIYDAGVFRGAIESIRGEFSSGMSEKKHFGRVILARLQDEGHISDFESSAPRNRFDYQVQLKSGRTAVIEMKGCLDGNNTNIFERPNHAHEFYIWSVCQNAAADPRKNAWSGIHSRLSAEIVQTNKQVDGLIIWDMVCGTVGRPCPKVKDNPECTTEIGPYRLPPPCLYAFPDTIPTARSNPRPRVHEPSRLEFLQALMTTFGVSDPDVYRVAIEVQNRGAETSRRTTVTLGGAVLKESRWTPIRRR